jgi:hypothetical protein
MSALITFIYMSAQCSGTAFCNGVEYTFVLFERVMLFLKLVTIGSYHISQFADRLMWSNHDR